MAFLPYKFDGSTRPQALDYLPAGTLTPKKGLALYWSSGKLALCSGTNKPEYICMKEAATANADGAPIPVLKIHPDMVFEVPLQEAGDSNTVLGKTVGIYSDGLQATKYNASGKATIVGMSGGSGTSAAAGDKLLVRF